MKVVKRVFKSAICTMKDMIIDLYENLEAVIILLMATYGITATLSRLPFEIALPAFIDAPMVLPVISVLIIVLLTYSIEWRSYAVRSTC